MISSHEILWELKLGVFIELRCEVCEELLEGDEEMDVSL